MSRKAWIGIILAAVLAIGWFLFRPERLFVNQTVSEAFPTTTQPAGNGSSMPRPLVSGQFRGYAHPTEGTATIYDLGDRRILRLTDFKTSNGPDVHVYLVAAPDVTDDATVAKAGFVELGMLKGNIGDQNYEVPESVDLDKYRAATIWCKRFQVNFGTAPLAPVPAESAPIVP
jgi:hypothetical protein